jgi:hypothetical protein
MTFYPSTIQKFKMATWKACFFKHMKFISTVVMQYIVL